MRSAVRREDRALSCTIYGGVNMHGQVKRLERGVDIIVACPGRLLDHMSRNTVSFKDLQVLVLDEADQMFDMGFLPDIRRIMRKLPLERQNLLFSATMPKEIRHLTAEILRNPVTVQVQHETPLATIAHALYPIDQNRKVDLVLQILKGLDMHDKQSVLIFTRTKHRAKRLGVTIERAGYKTASLQGNLSQNRRAEAMAGFRDGTVQVLVATDIAARGIDVQSVSHVINFDMPDTVAAYTHRIGRTGRAARNGDAFTFVSREDEPMVRDIERNIGTTIERRKVALPAMQQKLEEVSSDRDPRAGGGGRSFGRRPSRPSTIDARSGDARSGDTRSGDARSGGYRSNGPRSSGDASASSGQSSFRREGTSDQRPDTRPQGRYGNGSGNGYGPRSSGPRSSGPGSYGPRTGGTSTSNQRPAFDRSSGSRDRKGTPSRGGFSRGPRSVGQRSDGPRSEGQRSEGQRSEGLGQGGGYRGPRAPRSGGGQRSGAPRYAERSSFRSERSSGNSPR